MSKIYARPFVVATLALTLGVGTAGCQTISDLDPTGLIGGDDSAPTPDTQFPPDSQQQAAQDANTTTPDLASLPARPAQPDTTAQANTTQQVTAAGNQAQYSADVLRAGTDAAAPPPAATDAAAAGQALASANAPPSASPPNASPPSASPDAPPTAGSEDAAPPTAASSAPAANPNAAVPAQQVASAAPPAPPEAPPSAAAPSAEAAMPVPVPGAPMAAPPGAEPAVPAVPATAGAQMAMLNPSDSQLGFRPSSAPPLNPGLTKWVSPPVLAHYRETAAMAGSAGMGEPAVAAVPVTAPRRRGRGGIAGPAGPAMSGDVVANLDAIPGTPVGRAAAMNGGVPPTAIVYFPGDTARLSKSAMGQVRSAVAAFQASGGTGTVKVVGHASSRTANMPVERHLEVIFQKSQARANAVAQALIKAGIPADRVQIEAVGDSQPIYYESMPKGEDGNRRAEIFVQG